MHKHIKSFSHLSIHQHMRALSCTLISMRKSNANSHITTTTITTAAAAASAAVHSFSHSNLIDFKSSPHEIHMQNVLWSFIVFSSPCFLSLRLTNKSQQILWLITTSPSVSILSLCVMQGCVCVCVFEMQTLKLLRVITIGYVLSYHMCMCLRAILFFSITIFHCAYVSLSFSLANCMIACCVNACDIHILYFVVVVAIVSVRFFFPSPSLPCWRTKRRIKKNMRKKTKTNYLSILV